jgi:hypothetical protein
MYSRPTAAHVVVVHRGQIVVDEAVAMDAFERGRGSDDALAGEPENARRLNDEKRTQPFPRTQ